MNQLGADSAAERHSDLRCRRIQVAAESSRLADIRQFVESVGTEHGLDDNQIFDLKVAVSEACANAVEHSGVTKAPIELCAWFHPDKLVFEISDSGGFRLPRSEPGFQADSRGLGLPLMVALMDEVRIRKLPNAGTNVTLTLYLDR